MPERVRSDSPYEPRYGFSRAVRVGSTIHVAGTAPIPPPGGQVAETPFGQMMRCGEIAIHALSELGATAADVVRTRMFISSPDVADEVGRAHQRLFGHAAPAATMVVTQLLESDWFVEIEVEAVVDADA